MEDEKDLKIAARAVAERKVSAHVPMAAIVATS